MNYDEMPAGREMDVLVAEKVMGLEYRDWKPYYAAAGWYPKEQTGPVDARDLYRYPLECPFYSTDIAAAWQVVEHILKANANWQFAVDVSLPNIGALFYESAEGAIGHGGGDADTVSLAICRAALKASLK